MEEALIVDLQKKKFVRKVATCKFIIQHDAICKHSKCCPNPSIEIFLMKALWTYVHAVEHEISITKNLTVFVVSVSNNC